MARPSIVTDVVLTLRCGRSYRGRVCRRAVGWVGLDERGELAVEVLSRRVEREWFGGNRVGGRSWEERPLVADLNVLRRDSTEGIESDCDRHGACQFTAAVLEEALAIRARDLTST